MITSETVQLRQKAAVEIIKIAICPGMPLLRRLFKLYSRQRWRFGISDEPADSKPDGFKDVLAKYNLHTISSRRDLIQIAVYS